MTNNVSPGKYIAVARRMLVIALISFALVGCKIAITSGVGGKVHLGSASGSLCEPCDIETVTANGESYVAVADSGFVFDHWEGASAFCADQGIGSVCTINKFGPTGIAVLDEFDLEMTAAFVKKDEFEPTPKTNTNKLTLFAYSGGTATAVEERLDLNQVNDGALIATTYPNKGMEFYHWERNPEICSTASTEGNCYFDKAAYISSGLSENFSTVLIATFRKLPPPPPPTYTLEVTVQGLNGRVELEDTETGIKIAVTSDGTTTLLTDLADGTSYDIATLTQPEGKSCSVRNGVGIVNGENVTIIVKCKTSFQPSPTDSIAAGHYYSCVLLDTGVVKCWGHNREGQLGGGSEIDSANPVMVSGISNAVAVTVGKNRHACALLATGEVQCWGVNDYGQLGEGAALCTDCYSTTPVTIAGISNATAVDAGKKHTCALVNNGEVKCWGLGQQGQLGVGGDRNDYRDHLGRVTPETVPGISNAIALSVGGDNTCVLLDTGRLKCWGQNYNGLLDDGTTLDIFTPVMIKGVSGATNVAVGYYYICVLLGTGEVQCWGSNDDGEVGQGTVPTGCHRSIKPAECYISRPTIVEGITNATAVTAGHSHACVRLNTGGVRCWGDNYAGELGDGSTTASGIPVTVNGISNAIAVTAGRGVSTVDNGSHTCALLDTGEVQCWGDNKLGQLGDTSGIDSGNPVTVEFDTP